MKSKSKKTGHTQPTAIAVIIPLTPTRLSPTVMGIGWRSHEPTVNLNKKTKRTAKSAFFVEGFYIPQADDHHFVKGDCTTLEA